MLRANSLPWVDSVTILSNRKVCTLDDGYALREAFDHIGSVQVRIGVKPDLPIFAITITEEGNILPKKGSVDRVSGSITYEKSVGIFESQKKLGVFYPHYNQNTLCFLEFEGQIVRLYEISLIAQNNKWYLAAHKSYEFLCLANEDENDGEIDARNTKYDWPQLLHFLKKHIFVDNLYSSSEISGEEMDDYIGKVVWWSPRSGYGMVCTNQGSARVHWSQITEVREDQHFYYLVPDELVSFKAFRVPQRTSIRKTEFRLELVGVSPFRAQNLAN